MISRASHDTDANSATPSETKLAPNAIKVLEARYLKKDESGACIETPTDLFQRVAGTIADVETNYGATPKQRDEWAARFHALMATGDFMPNSPTLMNAGREMGMLSACFVLPVRDSINEIFDSIKHTALIQKAGGGTGFAFDELRPTGDYIQSSGGTTSGPISFWRAFSEATNAIQQGAFRRGANMGMLYIHHPDILKFLHAKQDLNQFTNYNISVKITDAWMEKFLEDPDSPHIVRNPRSGQAYLLPRDLDVWKYDVRGLIEIDCVDRLPQVDRAAYFTSPILAGELPDEFRGRVLTKRDIWDLIVQNAWQTGEPGVVFMDRINEENPTPQLGRMESTNPCGEQPLLPYEACNLGSINLGNFIKDACTDRVSVDWDRLREMTHISTRFLDNVIDANNYPLPEIDRICKGNRKIGIGIMGFADALYMLGVAYNSDEGVAWGGRFMQFINDEAHNCSELLARDRGCFPNWKGSHWQTKHQRLMRNACTTTVAPTGTISIIASCSGGIEPMFSLAFIRNVLRGQKQGEQPLVEVNETFRQVAHGRGFLSDELLERIAREGTLAHIEDIPEDIRRVFVCAHDIAPEWHMKMQAAFQQHNDSSISKTINFSKDASTEDVERIYRLAYKLRCKGVTVYRDGCREFQPMALKENDENSTKSETAGTDVEVAAGAPAEPPAAREPEAAPVAGAGNGNGGSRHTPAPPVQSAPAVHVGLEPRDLPEIVSGLRIRQMTPFGNMHAKITVDPRTDRELEVFAQLGKGGDVATSDLEAICRMISLWLRAGGSLRHVIKQLEGIGSSLQIPTRTGRIMSLGDGLATALKKYLRAKERFGLRPLLLGEVDLSTIDSPLPDPRATMDHPLRSDGNGNGNGSGQRASTVHADVPAASAQPAEDVAGRSDRAIAGRTPGDTQAPQNRVVKEVVTDSERVVISTQALLAGVVVKEPAAVARETVQAAATGSAPRGVPAGGGSGTALRGQRDKAQHYKIKCPECGNGLAMQEGCRKCHTCGWSAC